MMNPQYKTINEGHMHYAVGVRQRRTPPTSLL